MDWLDTINLLFLFSIQARRKSRSRLLVVAQKIEQHLPVSLKSWCTNVVVLQQFNLRWYLQIDRWVTIYIERRKCLLVNYTSKSHCVNCKFSCGTETIEISSKVGWQSVKLDRTSWDITWCHGDKVLKSL